MDSLPQGRGPLDTIKSGIKIEEAIAVRDTVHNYPILEKHLLVTSKGGDKMPHKKTSLLDRMDN